MRRIVNFSGGVGSWAAAKRCAERHGTAEMSLLFCDTFMEDNDLYRVLIQSAANVFQLDIPWWIYDAITGIPEWEECQSEYEHKQRKGMLIDLAAQAMLYIPQLAWIADGRTPWEIFRDERYIGNSRVDPCSKRLKRELMDAWRVQNCEPATTEIYIGIDWSEIHRLDGRDGKPGIRERLKPWTVVAPMCDRPCMTKAGMLHWMESEGIKASRLYNDSFPHNNCGGMCCKMGIGQAVHLLRKYPDRYAAHERTELATQQHIGRTDIAMLRDRRGGTSKPMTLRQLRLRVEAGESFGELESEWGGCGCAL